MPGSSTGRRMRVTSSILFHAETEPTRTGCIVWSRRDMSSALNLVFRLNQASGTSTLTDCCLLHVLYAVTKRSFELSLQIRIMNGLYAVGPRRHVLTVFQMRSAVAAFVVQLVDLYNTATCCCKLCSFIVVR